ncbi:MAG: efflux transporter outer membrane subunit [Gammaproteobacteria bacterium]|nr:efflux transporter outer membrane subunit [Gammaproteobacteria bacterium]
MKNSSSIKIFAVGCLSLLAQACSIPNMTQKDPDAPLPAEYITGVKDTANSASVNWNEFFDDPNLLALIEVAIANNKELNIVQQRIRSAEAEVQERRGEYLPFLSAGAGADVDKAAEFTRNGAAEHVLEIVEGEEFPKYLQNYGVGLFASWEIDVWKKLRNSTQAAAFEYMASKEGRNFVITHLVSEVAHAYYELVALDNMLVNIEQNIQLQMKGIDVVKQLIKYGREDLLALTRYEGEVAKNQATIYEIMQKIVETENEINVLLGRVPQPIHRSSGGFLDYHPKMIQEGIPSQLVANRPDIRKAELELKAAELSIEVARAEFYPSFEIKAGIGFEAFRTQYLFANPASLTMNAVGEVMAPLLNRNAIIAKYKNANANQIKAAYEYEQTVITAFTEVANKISNIDNLENQYVLKRKQVEALGHSIDLVNKLFQSARADYLEILLTQREALEAKMELIEIKQKQIVGAVDLYRALGGGWH